MLRIVASFLPLALLAPVVATAQTPLDDRVADATAVLASFGQQDAEGIPTQLLERARGIAVLPGLFRGGFIVGARRGKGVLVVRAPSGAWSNPAFVALTGGSIGWQIGAESLDLVLIFANEKAVRNIEAGKFTLGGDASAVAGPIGRHNTAAVTFGSEVYAYVRSRGLFAGAAFEGARIALDHEGNISYYDSQPGMPLGERSSATPQSAQRFLTSLNRLSNADMLATTPSVREPDVKTFPLDP